MSRLIAALLATSVLTAYATTTVKTVSAPAEIARKVYISATDGKGAPITDLTASDVTVKEGGKDRPVTSLEPATAPMQVAILVDDGGTGAFQAGVAQFLQKSFGHGQFSVTVFSPQATKLVDFTDDVNALKTALGRIGPRGRMEADGDQMPEAISDAAKTLQQRKAERPVILALTVAGGALHSLNPDNVLNTVRLSGAGLNLVFVTGADLGQVMGDGPKQSGGRIEEAGSGPAIGPAAERIADALLHQYLLTYTLPDGVKMNDRIVVSTSRKGITLTSPSRIADK